MGIINRRLWAVKPPSEGFRAHWAQRAHLACWIRDRKLFPAAWTAIPKEFEGGIGSLFDPCVNATGQRPYCLSRMEVIIVPSDLARSFGAICTYYHYRLIHRAQWPFLRAWFESTRERQLTLNKIIWRLSYKKIRRYNNSPPYVMARWPSCNRSPSKFPWLHPTLIEIPPSKWLWLKHTFMGEFSLGA